MRVLILGLGRMGSLLASTLPAAGHEVHGYDISERVRESARSSGVEVVESPEPGAYDAVIAAVPLDRSADVAAEIGRTIGRGAIYADVSTLKADVNRALRSLGPGPIKVSVHPLFGRGARGIAGRPIVLTPVEDEAREVRAASDLFVGAEILVMDEAVHDEAVAYSIALPHVLGYLFRWVSRGGPALPTTSRRLQELAAAVEVEEPDLTAQLISAAAGSRVLDLLEEAISAIRSSRDREPLLRSMRGDWAERPALYEAAYRALDLS